MAGADKGYDTKDFVDELREHGITHEGHQDHRGRACWPFKREGRGLLAAPIPGNFSSLLGLLLGGLLQRRDRVVVRGVEHLVGRAIHAEHELEGALRRR